MKSLLPKRITFLALMPIFIGVLSITNCKKKAPTEDEKQPSADFVADKASYTAGETIRLLNKSTDGASFRWTLPDGQTTKSNDVDYKTDENLGNATLSFKLEAFSSSASKSDLVVKNISVKVATGQLVVFPFGPGGSNAFYRVSIDGGPPSDYTSVKLLYAPACGTVGYPTFTLTAGPHVLSVISAPSGPYTATVAITPNGCSNKGV